MTRSEKSELQVGIEHNLEEGFLLVAEPNGEWTRVSMPAGQRETVVLDMGRPEERVPLDDPRYKAWRETVPSLETYEIAAARLSAIRGVVDYRRTTAMGTVVDTVEYDTDGEVRRWNFKEGPIKMYPTVEVVNAATGNGESFTIDAILNIANGEMLRQDEWRTKSYDWQPDGMAVAMYVEPSALIQSAMRRLGIKHPERTAIERADYRGNGVHYDSFSSERLDSQLSYASWTIDENGKVEATNFQGGSRVGSKYLSVDEQMSHLQEKVAKTFNQSLDGQDVTWSRRRYVVQEMAEFDTEHEKLVRLLGSYSLKPAYFLAGYETGTVAPTVGAVNKQYQRVSYLSQDEDLHGAIFDAQHEFGKRIGLKE